MLGATIFGILTKLVATLLVLKKLSLLTDHSFPVVISPKISVISVDSILPAHKEAINKAVKFANDVDKKFPSLYSRLEIGSNWENTLLNLINN